MRSATILNIIRGVTFLLAIVCVTWSIWVACTGGVDLQFFRFRLTSHDPWRPAIAAAIALAAFVAVGGRMAQVTSWLAAIDRVDDRKVAVALAAGICLLGIAYATTVAGGADSYGYVSEADRWLHGPLKIAQTWAEQAPWPSSRWSFSPLGYRPGWTDADAWSIVPIYSPGLPLLMAAAKFVGGQEAMFWIVPLLGGLLVLATFGLGRRLGAPRAGLIGALLVATSPAVLFMLVSPMTDVAVAGAWLVAFYFLLGESRASAFLAGLATAVAILIRPNNAFEIAVLGTWYLLRAWHSGEWRREIGRGVLFAAGVAPGLVAVAAINNYLYGSPLLSGYGTFAEQYTRDHIPANASRYFKWFVYAHTPVALVGFVPLIVPLKWFWPAVKDRLFFLVSGAFVVGLLIEFFSYLVFDVWWYLRFVIPCLPFIMIGIGAVVMALVRLRRPVLTLAAVGVVAVLAVRDFRVAAQESAFDLWRGDLRYVAAAHLTRRMTSGQSVIYAMQHSGSLRYYGGLLTVRYDLIDDGWLDRSVEWFESRGVHPYLLLEEWEFDQFKKQHAGAQSLACLDAPPLLLYEGGARVFLYDLSATRNPAPSTFNVVETYSDRMRSTLPAPREKWPLEK